MLLRSADGRHRSTRFPSRHLAQPVTLILLGIAVATVGRGQGTSPDGSPQFDEIRLARSGPRRFIDGLLGRGKKTPEEAAISPMNPRNFIPAPQPDPPPAAEDPAEAPAAEDNDRMPPAIPSTEGGKADRVELADTSSAGPSADSDDATEMVRTTASGLTWPQTSWEEMKQFAGRVADSARTLVTSEDDPSAETDALAADDAEPEASTESRATPAPATRVVISDRSGAPQLIEESTRVTNRPRKALPPPSAVAPPQTREFAVLKKQIERTLAVYKRRPLNTVENTPWEVMHGFIAFGIPSQVRVGRSGTLVNSIGWMNMGGRCRGQVMMVPAGDLPTGLIGYGVQGHLAQYLAILAQCRVAKESPLKLQGRDFTVADLVEQEKLCCRSGVELTFTLIALSHYLDTDEVWQSREGETWNLERLVEEELAQPVRTAACGGTHRLFALAYAAQRRREATGTVDGAFQRADKFVREYQVFALSKLQNPDGSFSTEWFKFPADRADDIDRKVQTTGHILEWLVASVDQPMLYHPRIVQATSFLARALASDPGREWKIGPMGHALHALTVYQERAWGTVHEGSIAAFHGPMKAVPNRPMMLAEDIDLLEPVLVR